MNNNEFGFTVLGVLAALLVAGMFHKSLYMLLQGFFVPFNEMLENILAWLGDRRGEMSSWIRDDVCGDLSSPNHFTGHLIGSVVNSVLLAIFLVSDLFLVQMALVAMGYSENLSGALGGLDRLAAISLIGAAVFWGMVLMDILGFTHLMPLDQAKPFVKKVLFGNAVCFVTLSIMIAVSFALDRYLSLMIINADSDLPALTTRLVAGLSALEWRELSACFCTCGMAALITVSAVCSAISIPFLLKLVVLTATALPLWIMIASASLSASLAKGVVVMAWMIVRPCFIALSRMGVLIGQPLLRFGTIRDHTDLMEAPGESDKPESDTLDRGYEVEEPSPVEHEDPAQSEIVTGEDPEPFPLENEQPGRGWEPYSIPLQEDERQDMEAQNV